MNQSFVRAAGLAVLFATAIATSADAGKPNASPTEGTVVTVSVNREAEGGQARIRVPDGIDLSVVSSIASAIEDFGVLDITLSVAPRREMISPLAVASVQQAVIQFLPKKAEIYVTDQLPFAFVQSLNEHLRELDGVDRVVLKSTRVQSASRDVPTDGDPFGG
jgi:hypothetical protein